MSHNCIMILPEIHPWRRTLHVQTLDLHQALLLRRKHTCRYVM